MLVIQHASAEALTTGRMMSSLGPEDIIRPVVNAAALACFITITGSIPLLVDY
jgi:hypothetical protein